MEFCIRSGRVGFGQQGLGVFGFREKQVDRLREAHHVETVFDLFVVFPGAALHP